MLFHNNTSRVKEMTVFSKLPGLGELGTEETDSGSRVQVRIAGVKTQEYRER